MTRNPAFLPWFIIPAMLTALGLIVAMLAVMQFSVRAYIPGSLNVGGFTLANFTGLFKSIYAYAFITTVAPSAKTAIFGLLLSYPLAYGFFRTRTTLITSTIMIIATPELIGGGRVSTVATMVYQLGFSSMNFPFAAALSIAGLVLTIVLLMALKRMTRALRALGEH